jgi:hypothetical protein
MYLIIVWFSYIFIMGLLLYLDQYLCNYEFNKSWKKDYNKGIL